MDKANAHSASNNASQNGPTSGPQAQPVSAMRRVRAFIKSRRARVKGFGLLLFYCHMLMVFAFVGKLYLPDLSELAKAAGVIQAWKTDTVLDAAALVQRAQEAREELGDFAGAQGALRLPEELKDLRKSAGEFSDSTRNSHAQPEPAQPDSAQTDSLRAKTASETAPAEPQATAKKRILLQEIILPNLTDLSGLPLAVKISSALVPILFGITTLSLLVTAFFRVGVVLGMGHALLCGWLLAKAAISLHGMPELFIFCLGEKLQHFANGGYAIWLGALAALLILLGLTAWMGRSKPAQQV